MLDCARGNQIFENHGRARFGARFGGPLHFNAKTLRKGKNFASQIS